MGRETNEGVGWGSGKNFREGRRKGKRRHKETKEEKGGKNVMLIAGTQHIPQIKMQFFFQVYSEISTPHPKKIKKGGRKG